MRLFEISGEYQHLLDNLCDPETGEISEQALVKLDEVGQELDKKCIAVASYIKNIDAERKAIEEAKRAMASREAAMDKVVTNLTNYLQTNMERTGKTEVSCPYFAIKIKKCPVSVDVLDEEAIPSEYKKRKEVVSVDKMKLKEELSNGIVIPGVALKQNNRLEIR